MRYKYTAAWTVVGGISLPEEFDQTVWTSSENARFLLTRSCDTFLSRVDEASAVVQLMLKKFFMGQQYSADIQTALDSEIEKIQTKRKKKIGSNAVLIFEAQGEIDAVIKEPFREHDNFIITFDTIQRSQVRQLYQTNIDAMKVAIACESNHSPRFAYLTDGAYLLNDVGKPIYSFSLSMSARGYASEPLREETTKRIRTSYTALNQENVLGSVGRLFSQMSQDDTDQLKAFLSGWAALEILIAKSFKSYEQGFFSPLVKGEQTTSRERFLARIKDVMKDKYRLTDKFIVVTAVLFPALEDTEAEKDYTKFQKLKKIRDSIFHGEPFSEKDLPIHELEALLRKYLVAQIATSSSVINTNADQIPSN